MTMLMWIGLLACPAKYAPEPGTVEDPASGPFEEAVPTEPIDTGDTGSVGPQACAALALREGESFGLADLYASVEPSTPTVLGSCGWGLAALDLNEDGLTDLLLAGAYDATTALVNEAGVLQPSMLIRFDDGPLPMGNGLAVGDFDGDFRPDFVLTRSTGFADRVYFNRGGGQFESVALADSEEESQTPSVLDVDGDGDLDVFVARHIDLDATDTTAIDARTARGDTNQLYINDGGSFSLGAAVGSSDAATFQGAPLDADADGDLDLYIVNDFGTFIEPSALMINDGHGVFTEAEDCGCDLAMFGMGSSVSDANNDGLPDMHVTDFGSPRLLMGMESGQFYEGALAMGAHIEPSTAHVTSWGTTFVDLDQDGWDEIATVFGPVLMGVPGDWSDMVSDPVVADLDDSTHQLDMILRNDAGLFLDASSDLNFDRADVGRAIVVADFNADGMPDLATAGMTQEREPYLRVRHGTAGCGPGITVAFPEWSGRDIGTRVEWHVGGETRVRWFLPSTTFSSSGPTLHLGLAGYAAADWVRITPHGGELVEHTDVPAGARLDQRSYQ
jgi:hypothetical protein